MAKPVKLETVILGLDSLCLTISEEGLKPCYLREVVSQLDYLKQYYPAYYDRYNNAVSIVLKASFPYDRMMC